ncbi:MAG: hypothetical protein BMS9Abin02_0990 [Anaerolineae bacterium]|nr:MAG: hypothetical protein BMS9Abin02_0990 [Anaerolineae bacterium]
MVKNLKERIQRNSTFDLLLLAGLWLLQLLNNAIWLHLDNYPPGWDSAHHLTMSLRWLRFWSAPSLIHLKQVAAASSYPPLTYQITIPFYLLFGQDADVAILASNSLWLGLLIFATYRLGREIFSRAAGLVAAVLVSFFPLIVAFEREFYLDLALTAVVTLALWLLVRCGRFDNRWRAVALGLVLGFGTLIKWPFIFIIAGPLAATFFLNVYRRTWSRGSLANLGLSIGIMMSIAAAQSMFNFLFLPGSLYNFENVVQLVTGFAGAAGHPPWYTFDGFFYYGLSLVNDQVSFLFAILFLASIPAFLRVAKRGRLVLIAGITITYLLATLVPIKEQRITMPYLPLLAVVSAVGLTSIRRPQFRYALLILVFSLGFLQYWAISYGLSFLPQELSVRNSWVEIFVYDQHMVRSPRDFQLKPGLWRHREVLDAIRLDSVEVGFQSPLQVPLIANTATYNPNTFNYFSYRDNLAIDFLYVWRWYASPLDLEGYPFDYLVLKSEANTELETWDKAGIDQAQAYIRDHQDELTSIYRSVLPDDSEVVVYRRGGAISNDKGS